MAQFHSQEEPVVAIKHKTEGMRVTTERFDYPTQILSKGSIAAVASITSHEVSFLDLLLVCMSL